MPTPPSSMDDNRLFREVTTRICGSLELEQALADCFPVMRQVFPVDEILLSEYEAQSGTIRRVASATATGGESFTRAANVITLSRDSRKRVARFPVDDVRLVNVPREDPVTREWMAQFPEILAGSVLYMGLALRGLRVGGLTLLSHTPGAFLPKHARRLPLLNEPFAIALSNALRYREVLRLSDRFADETMNLRRDLRQAAGETLVGADRGLRRVVEMLEQVAGLNSPVLFLGETGAGKEVLTNYLHRASGRREEPLLKINCGAIPETLIESELFGHEKGAFTGAVARKRGRFERADGGTLFLDEVAELPAAAQVKLLRFLQNGEIERVGGTRTIRLNVRIVAATHRDLERRVAEGRFREDLWYRLNVFPIPIPPLRERREDIPALAHHFMESKAREMNLPGRPSFSPGALDQLAGYDWPGNVRELQNVIERALILSGGRPLTFPHLKTPREDRTADSSTAERGTSEKTLDEILARAIADALERTGGRISGKGGAAKRLGVHPNTLRSRMQRLGLRLERRTTGKTEKA